MVDTSTFQTNFSHKFRGFDLANLITILSTLEYGINVPVRLLISGKFSRGHALIQESTFIKVQFFKNVRKIKVNFLSNTAIFV